MPGPVSAEVRLHGDPVGRLIFDRGGSEFHYTANMSAPHRAVLGQIFEDDPGAIRRARTGVPAWFANLLPEGELRKQVVRELGGGHIGDFTLLSRLGTVLPGAVSVHADAEPSDDLSLPEDAHPAHPLRHSLAGVQLKYSIHSERLSMPASGAGSWWIVKLPDRSLRDLTLNEYLTMRWLAAAGFPVPQVAVRPAGSVSGIPDGLTDPADLVYLIERFDRSPDGRVHVEDFAQIADVAPMFKYSESGVTYETLGRAIIDTLGEDGYADYVRRLVAMLITGNVDAHLKNWAMIYPDRRTPRLAPVYDFHSLTVYGNYRYNPMALSLHGEKLAGSVGLDHFRRLAEYCETGEALTVDVVGRAVHDLRTAWAEVRDEAQSRFAALATHYEQRLRHLPICAGK